MYEKYIYILLYIKYIFFVILFFYIILNFFVENLLLIIIKNIY